MANIRTKKQKEKGQVGKKNYSLFNPGKTMPIQARPDDASKARTRKEQEQARNERFISFLPLSLSYERMAGLYFPMLIGAEIYFCSSF